MLTLCRRILVSYQALSVLIRPMSAAEVAALDAAAKAAKKAADAAAAHAQSAEAQEAAVVEPRLVPMALLPGVNSMGSPTIRKERHWLEDPDLLLHYLTA